MKVEFVEQEIWDLIEEIANKDMPEGLHMYHQYNNIYVRSKGTLAQLMLRVQNNDFFRKIVIANVDFNNRRSGSLTKLIDMFVKHEYDVELECPLTEEIFAFMNNGPFLWENIEIGGLPGMNYKYVTKK